VPVFVFPLAVVSKTRYSAGGISGAHKMSSDKKTTPPTNEGENDGTPPANQGDEKTFSQADVNRMLAEQKRKSEERSKKDAEEAAAKAREAELANQAEFKKLADERGQQLEKVKADLAAAETHRERAERLEATLKAQLEAQIKDVPDHIKDLLQSLSVEDQIAYLAKNRDKLVAQPQNRQIAPTPSGDVTKVVTQSEEDNRKKHFAAQVRTYNR
jgi:membrane protein involved in colicin uptake